MPVWVGSPTILSLFCYRRRLVDAGENGLTGVPRQLDWPCGVWKRASWVPDVYVLKGFVMNGQLLTPIFRRLLVLVIGLLTSSLTADELQPLEYRNAGLEVDLGVGLWAWPIPMDADGDGDFDLIVSCPDKPSNGLWFFENVTGSTAANPLPVFLPGRKLGRTVHYVMPSYVDGKVRVLSPGLEYPRLFEQGLEEQVRLPIEARFHKPLGTQPKGPKVRHNQWRYVDFNGDQQLDLVVGIEDWSYYGWDDAWDPQGNWVNGPLHGWVYVFLNNGTTSDPDYAEPEFLQAGGERLNVYGCPSPNFNDFDNDGDLDLICGEFLDGFTYFQNVGSRTEPEYSAGVRLRSDSGQQLVMELQMIVPVAFDWDLDGDADLIVGDEDGRVAFLENVSPGTAGAVPIFRAPRYFRQQAETLKSGALATPVGYDWDADGDMDLISGNTAGFIEVFENLSGPGVAQPKWAAPERLRVGDEVFRIEAGHNGSIQGPAEAKWGYTTLSVADWNLDGLPDVVVNSILGRVLLLPNCGTRTEPRFAESVPIEVQWEGKQPELAWGWLRPTGSELLTQWRTTPVVSDLNGDGLPDLLMLDQEGYLAFFERARIADRLVLKSPVRAFVDGDGQPLRLTTGTAGRSGRRKLCITDWDGDGLPDLLLNSRNADLLRCTAVRDGKWVMVQAGTLATRNIEGHDVSPTTVDFDGNGIPDFVGGAEDGRFYFLRNPRAAGSE